MPYIKTALYAKLGDKVRLTEEKESLVGKFQVGDIVTIFEVDPNRGYGFMDEFGNKVTECGWSGFVLLT